MGSASLYPTALRTEYRLNPLGVDVPRPRLTWELQTRSEAGRALWQTAYQLRVSSQPACVGGDLWDSGEVESSRTCHVEYVGAALRARQCCYWRVRVRDQQSDWSEWSEVACWTMGALDAAFWTARWIGTGESLDRTLPAQPVPNTLPDAWLRRVVNLPAAPTRATAFVASVGFHELYVNGLKVGDAVLVPNVTDNSKRARYVAYEIGSLLRAGDNVLAIWLGTGWSSFSKFVTEDKPRAPLVLGQFDVDLPGGRGLRFGTDATWRTHPSPSRLLGSWEFRDFGGEAYDARLEEPAWACVDFDDSGWTFAQEFQPRLRLSADCAEPNQRVTELRAVGRADADGTARYDFGRNVAGWLDLPVEGEPGEQVEIEYSERADERMTHALHSAYVIGPTGRGAFRNRFNYGVGRWVTVSGLRTYPTPGDVTAWLVRPAYAPAAAFECSVPLLNQIFATAAWTFENLTVGAYVVDCPHRERMGYGGDAHATTLTGLSLFKLGAFYTKWAQDWRDVQGRAPTWGIGILPGEAGADGHEEGNLPYTAPTYWGGGGPAWSGYCVHLPWEVYRRYGDTRILEENFTTIERWLAFLETKADGAMLGRYGGKWDFLGDWLWPGAEDVNGDTRETLFFNNCYWIHNLQIAAEIAAILGRQEQREAWLRRADEVRRAVHPAFFHPEDASYVNGSQAYLAIALLVNVPPPSLRKAVWRRLEHEIMVVREGHIHAGITGGAFLFQLLMEARRDDLIYTMVNRTDEPGWGAMIEQGATTFWESWGADASSHLHSSYLFVGAWFVHGVLGIQPSNEAAGFRTFIVRPGVVDRPELHMARGHFDAITGRISVAWRRSDALFELDLTVPPNGHAAVHLPTLAADSIRESHQPLAEGRHMIVAGHDGNRTIIKVPSGAYRFTCPAPTVRAGRPLEAGVGGEGR